MDIEGLFYKILKLISKRERMLWYCSELNYNLSSELYNKIKFFRKNTPSHPMTVTSKEWDEILRKIEDAFFLIKYEEELIDEIFTQLLQGKWTSEEMKKEDTNKLSTELADKYMQAHSLFEKYFDPRIEEGLELFAKWFRHLSW